MNRKRLGVLLGDSAGVGPEIIAKVAVSGKLAKSCVPIIIGDAREFEDGLSIIGVDCPHYKLKELSELDESRGIAVFDTADQDPKQVERGRASAYCGAGDIHMVKSACQLLKTGKIAGFIYGPLHKGAMKEAGMTAASETELMAQELGYHKPVGEINMLGDLMTVRVTSHIPLKDVSAALSVENILETIELARDTDMQFGVNEPRIAVAGLNPHNGENGICGKEEIEIIIPAVEKAKAKGWNVTGPIPGDIVFMRALKGEFDCVVTMYHDQGQIALKTVGFDQGVTICGGLPYPVTTGAHGTAFGRAGQGRASTSAFENALHVLCRMAQDR